MQANQFKFVNKARAIIYLVNTSNKLQISESAKDLESVLKFIESYLEESEQLMPATKKFQFSNQKQSLLLVFNSQIEVENKDILEMIFDLQAIEQQYPNFNYIYSDLNAYFEKQQP